MMTPDSVIHAYKALDDALTRANECLKCEEAGDTALCKECAINIATQNVGLHESISEWLFTSAGLTVKVFPPPPPPPPPPLPFS